MIVLLALAVPTSAQESPYFQVVPGAFDPQPCDGDGCYTNYLRLTDLDADGDLDVLLPNSSGGADEPLVIHLNDGAGTFTNATQTAIPGGFSGHLRQIAVGDVDGDGDPDLYGPDATGDADHLWVNDGAGTFTDESLDRLPAGLQSNAAATRMGDVDGDGDLDLLTGDRFGGGGPRAAHLYVNDGAGHFTDATNQLPSTSAGDVAYDFDLFDADRDFDLDLLLDMHSGTSMLWTNDGAGTFTAAPFPSQGALKYGPVACDVDGDTDLDVWFDNAGPGYTEQLLINDGAGGFTDETASRVTGNPGDDDNGVACVDVDGDGDLDAAIASLGQAERLLLNDGTGRFTHVPGAFSPTGDSTLWFDFGDLDGDGRMDLVTGQGESGDFTDRLYLGTELVAVDLLPPVILAVEATPATVEPSATPAVRFAVRDEATTDEGPRLSRAWVEVDGEEVDAGFVGGDLLRAVLPAKPDGSTVSWRVCAADRRGNEACSDPQVYEVVAPEPTGPTTPTDTGLAGTDTGSGGSDAPPDPTPPDPADPGCGCRTSGGPGGAGGGATAILLLAIAGVRRVRRSRPEMGAAASIARR